MRKFIRFPAFSLSHGWQSPREVYLKNSSVWTYDLDTNTWRYMRPCPEVWPSPLRGAAYDPHHQVVVLHGGEGSGHGTVVYDLYSNAWQEMKPKPAPPPGISQPGFTYDAVNRLFVLFGSQFANYQETWVYDLRKNAWRAIEVAEHPPADKSCPVLAADTRNGVVLCNLRAGEGLETWALDAAKSTWTRLKVEREAEPSGGRNRILMYLPDKNLFILENRTDKEQQVWTFRYSEAPPAPLPTLGIKVVTEADGARLTWEAPAGGPKQRYNVLRGEGKAPWQAELKPIATSVETTEYKDAGLAKGGLYPYQVRPVDAEGKEGTPSFMARTQPPVVVDVCVSAVGPKRVELEWAKPAAEDIVGYHVERAEVSAYSTDQVLRIKQRYRHTSEFAVGRIKRIGQFQRLTQRPVEPTQFVDETVDLAAGQREPAEPALGGSTLRPDALDPNGRPYRYAIYAYRVVAINRLGVEGGPSPFAFTYPSAVQGVFSKEEGPDATRLKWRANREKGIKGYLVYRQDGRYDNEPITRLTPEPIAAAELTDETAGKGTRRYEVVAVDTLGQEGEPSQPVWSRREWRSFYLPYTGEWHQ